VRAAVDVDEVVVERRGQGVKRVSESETLGRPQLHLWPAHASHTDRHSKASSLATATRLIERRLLDLLRRAVISTKAVLPELLVPWNGGCLGQASISILRQVAHFCGQL